MGPVFLLTTGSAHSPGVRPSSARIRYRFRPARRSCALAVATDAAALVASIVTNPYYLHERFRRDRNRTMAALSVDVVDHVHSPRD